MTLKKQKIVVILPFGIGDAIQALVGINLLCQHFNESDILVITSEKLFKIIKTSIKNKVKVFTKESVPWLAHDDDVFLKKVDFNGLPWVENYFPDKNFKLSVTHICFKDLRIKNGLDCIFLNNKTVPNTPFFDIEGATPHPAWTLYAKMALTAANNGSTINFQKKNLFPELVKSKRKGRKLKTVSIAPCGSLNEKHWPIFNYVNLSKRLFHRGYEINVFLGQSEMKYMKYFRDKHIIKKINKNLVHFKETASFSSLVISNDCGPMHIGGALKAPLIAIFGETSPKVWFPYKKRNQIAVESQILNSHKKILWPSVEKIDLIAKKILKVGVKK